MRESSPNDWLCNVDAFLKDLAVPIQVFAATQKDDFRKPCVGMWKHLESKCNGGLAIDKSQCFYVGDAVANISETIAMYVCIVYIYIYIYMLCLK